MSKKTRMTNVVLASLSGGCFVASALLFAYTQPHTPEAPQEGATGGNESVVDHIQGVGTDLMGSITGKPSTETMNQGSKIYVDMEHKDSPNEKNACTLGYLNKQDEIGYTAAHCGYEGATVYDGKLNKVGILHVNKSGDDTASVSFDPNIKLGDNKYSSNTIADFSSIQPGQEACMYGHKTNKVMCSTVENVAKNGEVAYKVGGFHAEHGDSGGPVWRKSDGNLIGTYVGMRYVIDTNQDVNDLSMYPHPN